MEIKQLLVEQIQRNLQYLFLCCKTFLGWMVNEKHKFPASNHQLLGEYLSEMCTGFGDNYTRTILSAIAFYYRSQWGISIDTKDLLKKKHRACNNLPRVTQEIMSKLVVGLTNKPDKLLVVDMLLSSGVRRKELANLEDTNIDYKKGIALIQNTKNYHDRWIRFSKDLCQSMLEYKSRSERKGCPQNFKYFLRHKEKETGIWKKYKPESISRNIIRWRDKCGIEEKITAHSFRRTWIHELLRAGVQQIIVSKLSGHETVEATKMYDQTDIKDLLAITTPYQMWRSSSLKQIPNSLPQILQYPIITQQSFNVQPNTNYQSNQIMKEICYLREFVKKQNQSIEFLQSKISDLSQLLRTQSTTFNQMCQDMKELKKIIRVEINKEPISVELDQLYNEQKRQIEQEVIFTDESKNLQLPYDHRERSMYEKLSLKQKGMVACQLLISTVEQDINGPEKRLSVGKKRKWKEFKSELKLLKQKYVGKRTHLEEQ